MTAQVDNHVSLQNIADRWIPEINEHSPGSPIVLVALKCDLRQDSNAITKLEQRGLAPIQYEAGLQVARQVRAAAYLECSAKFNRGVAEVFNEVARLSVGKSGKTGAGAGGGRLRKKARECIIL
ncbi:hypothetical protein CF327_g6649 [Tilletia walkeri]|nr:hypothetical protein CF327_g6649 [Tilletia walkeri]